MGQALRSDTNSFDVIARVVPSTRRRSLLILEVDNTAIPRVFPRIAEIIKEDPKALNVLSFEEPYVMK